MALSTLGQRIAQARRLLSVQEERDVTRSEVAEAIGVDQATVTLWEQDRRDPREDALSRLAAYLGVTTAWLRYGVTEGMPGAAEGFTPQVGKRPPAPLEGETPRRPNSQQGRRKRGA